MSSNSFRFNGFSQFDFSITYSDIDVQSPLNTNESHIHKECEIYINLSGDVSFEVENHIYPISAGSVIITRPYEYHHCIYHSNKPHRHYWILFSPEDNDELLKMFFQRLRGVSNHIMLDSDCLERACEIMQSLLKKDTPELDRYIGFFTLLKILDSGTRLNYDEDLVGLPEDVRLALKYMYDNIGTKISVSELAEKAFVSVNTLERHFKACLNATPFEILKRKRLIYSLELLRHGKTLYETCELCGFSDYSNFIMLFRKQFGITPLKFKKSLGI